VELHHERPDGRGYPYGLRGDEIPLFARIVHVADAFDAMTSARAYRPARPAAEAMAELWRHVGTDFAPPVVQAMAAVWDTKLVQSPGEPPVMAELFREPVGVTVPFRLRPRLSGRDDVVGAGDLARCDFHLRHGGGIVVAFHPRRAAPYQLLRAQRCQHGELVGVDVNGAGHHALVPAIISGPFETVGPPNVRSILHHTPGSASAWRR
jgi:hypothetical protein